MCGPAHLSAGGLVGVGGGAVVVVAPAAYQQRAQPRAGLALTEPNTEEAASTVALTFNQITVLMSYFYNPVMMMLSI